MRALKEWFVAGLPERVDTMRAALRNDDRGTLQYEAHRLAGTGLSYGLPQLTSWGREMEQKVRAGEPSPALEAELERLSRFVASITSSTILG